MNLLRWALGAVAALVIGQTSAQAVERLTIATGLKPPFVTTEAEDGFLEELAKEAFRRAGLDLRVIVLPAERVLRNANDGLEDGCLLRIKGLEKTYPNLVRVPESLINSQFVGYTTGRKIPVSGWGSLAGQAVTYITGWKIFDNNVKQAEQIIKTRDANQMFDILRAGRADVALYERWQGLWVARQMGLKNLAILDPPFVDLKMYMYLNKKHQHHIPKVTEALREMKQDGSYQALYDHILAPLDSP
ncbi:ABC transporter substrate-binding protein [Magnetospira sp. QH-2]|uniref:substrate-binding periplasmic protein n=1 Tax=Magnetospira sp. (strain QH-2) TaxID=1288970 RepID=UPI0003E80F8D|nr:transporter substrate-binding domain-containing protein [Magnetospira sp. QH-2]CCQ73725.1 Conserved exported protein of unknown function [Magnetospira sp. QH-2]